MKRILLLALAIAALSCAPALAEGGLIGALATPAPTAAPTAAPTPAEFSGEGLRLRLPPGFEALEGDALEGYEAAVRFDYPGGAETVLAAANADQSATVAVAAVESDMTCLDAAREAARELLDDADAAKEARFGANECAGFACAIDDQPYRLYFFSDEDRLIAVGASGLEEAALEELLGGLEFE